MFNKRWFRVVFSAVFGAILVEMFHILSNGKLQLNFIFFAIPINLLIILILYIVALIKNNKALKQDTYSDEVIDDKFD